MDDSEPDIIENVKTNVQETIPVQENTPIQEKLPVQEDPSSQENTAVQASNDDTADFSFFKFGSGSKKKYNAQEQAAKAGVASLPVSSEDMYDMSHARRGLALIFSNVNFDKMAKRVGVEHDEKSLKPCLQRLGFKIKYYHDEYMDKIQDILRNTSHQDHSDVDCFLCIFMTHGDENGIYGRGPKPVSVKKLTSYFKGNKCPTLVGKPKLFFIQACRGDEVDHGVGVEQTDAGLMRKKKATCKIPTSADFLMSYSTVEDYFAFLNKKRGSWFIQALTSELDKCDGNMEICTLLQRVTRRVAYDYQANTDDPRTNKKKQCPCYSSTLTKQLFLGPK